MTFRAIAWDIDGTLMDSEPLHRRVLIEVSARYGLALTEAGATFTGVAMDDVWRELSRLYSAPPTKSAWLEEIVETYVAKAPTIKPFPGVVETLDIFDQRGLRQCCVSNSARRIVDANIAALGAGGVFAFSISRDEIVHGKPDPAPYALACQRLGFAPGEVLAIEDSAAGLMSARAAGCPALHYGVDFTDYQGLPALIDESDWGRPEKQRAAKASR